MFEPFRVLVDGVHHYECVRYPELADVMEHAGYLDGLHLFRGKAEAYGNAGSENRHVLCMASAIPVPQFDQVGECLYRPVEIGRQPLVQKVQILVLLAQLGGLFQNPRFKPAIPLLQLFVLPVDDVRQPPVFLQEHISLHAVPQDLENFIIVPGLGYVAVRSPLVNGVDGGIDIRIAGEENAQGVRSHPSRLHQKLHPRHPRHPLVGNDQCHIRLCF